MKTYVQAHGFEVCKSVIDGYKEPSVLPTIDNRNNSVEIIQKPQMHF
jgi:hypothetical protein